MNYSHFSLIADEVTSHGKEILFVCLRFLEINHKRFHVKTKKNEILHDFYFLEEITGQSIAENIFQVLKMHKIDIKNCRGQAYDTTASMSFLVLQFKRTSERAPDAEFQEYCLHSINLVICHLSQIRAVRNIIMMDSSQQTLFFLHNSPKRALS